MRRFIIIVILLIIAISCNNESKPNIDLFGEKGTNGQGKYKKPFCGEYHEDTKKYLDFLVNSQWKYEKHLRWDQKCQKYSLDEVILMKDAILKIDSNQIYFEGIMDIDSCFFSRKSLDVSNLFDKSNDEYYWYEEGDCLKMTIKETGPLPNLYNKSELSKIKLLKFGSCFCFRNLYLKEDTLILNFEGLTWFMTKKEN
jgi:hypothetical protein